MTRAEDGSQPVTISRCRRSCGYLSRSSPLPTAYHARPLSVKPRPLYLAPRTRQSSATTSHPVRLVQTGMESPPEYSATPCAAVLHYCGSQNGTSSSSPYETPQERTCKGHRIPLNYSRRIFV